MLLFFLPLAADWRQACVMCSGLRALPSPRARPFGRLRPGGPCIISPYIPIRNVGRGGCYGPSPSDLEPACMNGRRLRNESRHTIVSFRINLTFQCSRCPLGQTLWYHAPSLVALGQLSTNCYAKAESHSAGAVLLCTSGATSNTPRLPIQPSLIKTRRPKLRRPAHTAPNFPIRSSPLKRQTLKKKEEEEGEEHGTGIRCSGPKQLKRQKQQQERNHVYITIIKLPLP